MLKLELSEEEAQVLIKALAQSLKIALDRTDEKELEDVIEKVSSEANRDHLECESLLRLVEEEPEAGVTVEISASEEELAIAKFEQLQSKLNPSARAKEAAERSDRAMRISPDSWHRHGKRGPGGF